jgi:hypothetical protein
MSKCNYRSVSGLLPFLVLLLASCQAPLSTSSSSSTSNITANLQSVGPLNQLSSVDAISATKSMSKPPSASAPATSITSFTAQVTKVTSSKRDPTYRLSRTFIIYKKIINGIICIREDFPASSFPDGIPRSSVINGTEQRIFKTISGQIIQRTPLAKAQSANPAYTSLYQRLPLDKIQGYMKKNSFLLSANSTNNSLTAGFPNVDLQKMSFSGHTVLSYQEYYDLNALVKTGSQTSFHSADGCTHTKTVAIAYQALLGQPVPSLITTVDEINNPQRVNVSDRLIPTIRDLSQLPTISSAELEQKKADPKVKILTFKPIIGDPSSLDDTLTTTEAYTNITTNNVADSVFN